MKLSAPLYQLKRQARLLSRAQNIPLYQALDRIAAQEGFAGWSLLAAKLAAVSPASRLYSLLEPGDLVLVGARPGQGKTLLGVELLIEAMKLGHRGFFFSLEYTQADVIDRFRAIGADHNDFGGLFCFDGSDAISAPYMAQRLAAVSRGALVVVDYLQLLDQRRENPELAEQLRLLSGLAVERGAVIVLLSQIDRAYDPAAKALPDMTDLRLPNAVDTGLFTRTCFLHAGQARIHSTERAQRLNPS